MERSFAVATGLALLAGIGLVAYAGFLRYRGRRVPAGVVRLAAGLLGAAHGTSSFTSSRRHLYPQLLVLTSLLAS